MVCDTVYFRRLLYFLSGMFYHILIAQDGGSNFLVIIIIHQTTPTAAYSRKSKQMGAGEKRIIFVRLSSAALLFNILP
jgi:hypothetical protein